jgi:hypothetical protein
VRRAGVAEHLERPAGVTAAGHHRGVDVGGAGIPVLEHPDRVVELRAGQRRGEKSRPVPRDDRGQAELGCEPAALAAVPAAVTSGSTSSVSPGLPSPALVKRMPTTSAGWPAARAASRTRCFGSAATMTRPVPAEGYGTTLMPAAVIWLASSSSTPPESLISATSAGTGARS